MKWRERLPSVEGEYTFGTSLAPFTTLKMGGQADVLYEPKDFEDLQHFLKFKPRNIPMTYIGEGSNLLVRDGGIRGVVVHLGRGMDNVRVDGHKIYAEAGAKSGKVARAAREESLTGAEFLCGIPGSVGGALKMNAGAYGRETVDILTKVWALSPEGEKREFTPEDVGFFYRYSGLPEGWVYMAAEFELEDGEKALIRDKMRAINKNRSTSQPLDMPSSGSWFKNVVMPDGTLKNAWKIVDEAGCRGWREGDAQVSEKHCNFFVNLGQATSRDMNTLSLKVEKEIKDKFGIEMVREVKMVGESA